MSQGQNSTRGKQGQKKPANRQNDSFSKKSNSGQFRSNVMSRNNQGLNLGGFGEMRSAPTAMSRTIKTAKPKIVTLRNGDCNIVHREYIQDVVAPSIGANFSVTNVSINPGQAAFAPWLSKIAQNFESYRFKKLKFCYETEAPSTLGGTLVMAVDYDASDAPPANKQQALAYRGSVRSAPWSPSCHQSVKEDLEKQKSYYVRPGAVPPNTDVRLWDVGDLYVATQGISTNSATCGELYVEYDVLLMTPVYESILASSTVSMVAASTATPLLNGIVQGTLITSITNAGAVTLSNLIVGQEYVLCYATTGANAPTGYTVGSLVGLTLKNQFLCAGGAVNSFTSFTASASVGSFALACNISSASLGLMVFAQVPLSAA